MSRHGGWLPGIARQTPSIGLSTPVEPHRSPSTSGRGATDDLVIDNGTPNYSEVGSWSSSANPGFIGTDSRFTAAGTGSDEATWSFTVPASGVYEVQAWWIASSNRAPDAIYRVTHEGGADGTTVDQRAGGGIWNPLGEYFFQVDTGYQVRLNDDVAPDTFVSADAIRVRPVGQWDRGELSELPPNAELRALPGGGNGIPSVVSIPPINASRFLER